MSSFQEISFLIFNSLGLTGMPFDEKWSYENVTTSPLLRLGSGGSCTVNFVLSGL